MAEVMPMQIRGKGNAFAVGIGNWAVSTLWNQVSPVALGVLKWRFYFVFVAWSECLLSLCESTSTWLTRIDLCVSFPVIYFFFKETKQQTLEEIDLLFGEQVLERVPERRGGEDEKEAVVGSSMNVENIEATR